MPPSKRPSTDLGAGLNLSPPKIEDHPAGPPRHGQLTQAERAFTLASTFFSGILAISASQFLGAPLKLIDPEFYQSYMAYTKESFAVLITCLTQWWAPTIVRVSGDASMKGHLVQNKDGSLKCNFADRLVLMANHQLYTDWMYLWWIAYTNGMHGHIYIILKESIKNIPIVGWGCQFYNFIFLARNWEEDKLRFQRHLEPLNNPKHPMWLLIFPEGTNLSASTRARSKKWAEQNGLQDMKHQLLPRSTGLRFCLQELRKTTEWLYDCTIAYEGVPPGQFGQDIFTLRSSFFEGRPPKSVNMHWRRFRISSIPIDNPKAFDVWLRNRWREKDYMLEHFTRSGGFPVDDFWKEELNLTETGSEKTSSRSVKSLPRFARTIETEVKSGSWNEFVKIFAPISALMMALMLAYGASPDQLPFPNQKEFLEQQMKAFLSANQSKAPLDLRNMERLLTDEIPSAQLMGEKGKNQMVQKLTEHHLQQLDKARPMRKPQVGGPMNKPVVSSVSAPGKTATAQHTRKDGVCKAAIQPKVGAAPPRKLKAATSLPTQVKTTKRLQTQAKQPSPSATKSATAPTKRATTAGIAAGKPSAKARPTRQLKRQPIKTTATTKLAPSSTGGLIKAPQVKSVASTAINVNTAPKVSISRRTNVPVKPRNKSDTRGA